MTLGQKLFLSFGAVLLLTLAMSVVALKSANDLGRNTVKAIAVNSRKMELGSQLQTALAQIAAAQRGILAKSPGNGRAAADDNSLDFQASAEKIKTTLDELAALPGSEEARRLLSELRAVTGQMAEANQEMLRASTAAPKVAAAVSPQASGTKTAPAAEAAAAVPVPAIVDTVSPLAIQAAQVTDRFMTLQGAMNGRIRASAETGIANARWTVIVLIVLAVVVCTGIALVVQHTNRTLRQAIGELSEGAQQVASAASQLSSSSQWLAQGASEQAASLEETSASSEEINSMARKNSENSRSATGLVLQSQQKFQETNQALEQMVSAMAEIGASSNKISKIIKVIDEIAFQTNILALNAAVEAARAGEAGMGFAVVAEEVRNLAQRCSQAAKDTASLIEESISKSNGGKVKVDQVAGAIRSITLQADQIKTLVEEVNLGSEEQSRGIDQVGKAIHQMDQITQKIAANAEESASAAEQLTAQSTAVREVVNRLALMVAGSASPIAAKHASTAPPLFKPHHGMSFKTGLAALRGAVERKTTRPVHEPEPSPSVSSGDFEEF